MSNVKVQDRLALRYNIRLSPHRAAALRHRARQLGEAPTTVAARMVENAIDFLLSNSRFLEDWEADSKRRAQVQAYERMMGQRQGEEAAR